MSSKTFYWFVILSLLLVNFPKAHGQNYAVIDSLQKENLIESSTNKKVDNLLSIADEYSHYNTDSTFFYIETALHLAHQTGYKAGAAEAHFLKSYYYDLIGKYDTAIVHLENATELFIEVGDSSYLSGCYNNLGVLYSYGTNQKKSLEYFIKSAQIGEMLQDSFSLAESYSNIAGFYEELKEYSSALIYFKKALLVDKHYNSKENIAISHLDIGYMNIKLRRFNEALENLKVAQKLMAEVEDPFYQIILYQRLANYYSENANLDSAMFYLVKAQQQSSKLNAPILSAESLSIKSSILLKQHKFKAAIATIDSATNIYKNINAKSTFSELYKLKAEAYFGLGLYSRGHGYLQLANQKSDSLKSYEIAELLSNFEKLEVQKEERSRILLRQELENQRTENALLTVRSKLSFAILLAIFLGVVLLIAIYLFVLKQRHNKLLEKNYELINHQKDLLEKSYENLKENENRLSKLNATKDKFFSIIAHDLKNPFNTLIGISELMMSDPDIKHTDDYDELMKGMFETAQSGHNLLQNLLEWSRSQVGSIQIAPQLITLQEEIPNTISFFSETAKAKNISISFKKPHEHTVFADYNMVNFTLRNLINNAIKFSNENTHIEIFIKSTNETTTICIKDQGIGMSAEMRKKLFKIEHSIQRDGTANEKGTGLGLILCKEFVEKNKGEIWVESTECVGSIFCFSLPKKNE